MPRYSTPRKSSSSRSDTARWQAEGWNEGGRAYVPMKGPRKTKDNRDQQPLASGCYGRKEMQSNNIVSRRIIQTRKRSEGPKEKANIRPTVSSTTDPTATSLMSPKKAASMYPTYTPGKGKTNQARSPSPSPSLTTRARGGTALLSALTSPTPLTAPVQPSPTSKLQEQQKPSRSWLQLPPRSRFPCRQLRIHSNARRIRYPEVEPEPSYVLMKGEAVTSGNKAGSKSGRVGSTAMHSG